MNLRRKKVLEKQLQGLLGFFPIFDISYNFLSKLRNLSHQCLQEMDFNLLLALGLTQFYLLDLLLSLSLLVILVISLLSLGGPTSMDIRVIMSVLAFFTLVNLLFVNVFNPLTLGGSTSRNVRVTTNLKAILPLVNLLVVGNQILILEMFTV